MPKSALRAVIGRMEFSLHATRRTPHGASRLEQAMSAWLVKTRCAPSRHSRDARVYDHATTAMQKLSIPPQLLYPLVAFSVFMRYRLPLPLEIHSSFSEIRRPSTMLRLTSSSYLQAGRPGGVSGYPRAWYRSVS